MGKQNPTPEQEAAKKAAEEEKAAEEKKGKKVECIYCGEKVPADKAVTDEKGNTFCDNEHADMYAKTMKQIHQNY